MGRGPPSTSCAVFDFPHFSVTEPHAGPYVAENQQGGLTAFLPSCKPLCKPLFPGGLFDSREPLVYSSWGLRFFAGHILTKLVPPPLPGEAPEAKASLGAATLPSSSDTCPEPWPHPEGGLTPSHSLWGQKDLQDRKHPGLQKDPVQKEEAKIRGQHRQAPGWEAFANRYIHWELAGTCICSLTPSPMALPRAPPSDLEEVQAWTFLRIIPSCFSSLGNSRGPCGEGGPGEPSTGSSTHRGAGQTLQTSEATVSLQSPLASLSSFSFVTSGALRALGTRHTDTGWVSSAQSKSPQPASPEPRSPRSLRAPPHPEPARQDPAQGTQILTGIPRAPAGPAGPMGPCAPCGVSGGQRHRAVEAGMAHCCVCPWAGHRGSCFTTQTQGCSQGLGQGRGGREVEMSSLPTRPPSCTMAFTESRYSQPLLGLPACQLGRRGQESQGARGLQGHPRHRSLHGHPVRREVPGSERNFQRRQGGMWL